MNYLTVLGFDLDFMVQWGFCLFFFEERMGVSGTTTTKRTNVMYDQLENISSSKEER